MSVIESSLEFLKVARDLAEARRKERTQRERRYAVALAFNYLWTYRPYPDRTRWMCPTCNQVHERLEQISGFTGLQYPRCCTFSEGHRLYHEAHATKGATRG